jgi:hypothetical protein
VARGFPVLADNHLQQAVVDGLLAEGWDVVRAIDVFPEGTEDEVLFGHAAKEGRVFVTNDASALIALGGIDRIRPPALQSAQLYTRVGVWPRSSRERSLSTRPRVRPW